MLQSVALAAAVVPIFLWLGLDLPRVPWLASDSASYLEFSPVRPHGYSLFLAAYRLGFEDLAHLPRVQLALYLAAVLFLAAAVGRRTRSFTAAAATLLLVGLSTDASVFPWILSDPIYTAALTAGAACLLLHVESHRTSFLLLASAALASAFLIRPIGLALLPGFAVAVLAHTSWRRRRLVWTAVLTALPMVFLYCGAASSQLIHNGRFVLGNWGGMHVLGKVPLLSGRLPEASPLAHLNSIVDELQPARDKLRRANDPFLEALVAGQYYEYMRWFVIVPELERSWPSWRDGDEYHRGKLATTLVISYVAADPIGFLRRTAVDLVGLWTMPRWLTEGEQRAAISKVERIGELPLLTAFARTPEGQLDFYKIVPGPSEPAKVFTFRTVVLAFWILSIGYAWLAACRHWRRLFLIAPDVLFLLLAVHTAYLGTAIMEGAYDRYLMPTWPLLGSAPILALGLTLRRRSLDDRM